MTHKNTFLFIFPVIEQLIRHLLKGLHLHDSFFSFVFTSSFILGEYLSYKFLYVLNAHYLIFGTYKSSPS